MATDDLPDASQAAVLTLCLQCGGQLCGAQIRVGHNGVGKVGKPLQPARLFQLTALGHTDLNVDALLRFIPV